MLKLFVLFSSFLVFIYILSGIEQNVKSNKTETLETDTIDVQLIYPVQNQLDAYNNRDISGFINNFSDDVKLYRLQSGELFCEGRDNLIAVYGAMFSKSKQLHCEVINRITCGDFVIDEELVKGLKDNETVHATAIYEVQNSKIIKAWFINGK